MSVDNDIGRLQANVQTLQDDIADLKADMRQVLSWVNQQQGGKKAFTAMLTTAGAIGAALAEGVNALLHWGHPR